MDYPSLSPKLSEVKDAQSLIIRRSATSIPLTTGMRLTATVVKQSPDNNLLNVLVKGKTLLAQSTQRFAAGQTLTLEVTQAGKTPTLRVLSVTARHDEIRQTLMETIPKQLKLSTLYNHLFFGPPTGKKPANHPVRSHRTNRKIAARVISASRSVHASVKETNRPTETEAIDYTTGGTGSLAGRQKLDGSPLSPNSQAFSSLLKTLPKALHPLLLTLLNRPNIKTTGGLKQAISQSGLFLEAKLLADPEASLTEDLKGNFLKLQDALQKQRGEQPDTLTGLTGNEKLDALHRHVDGAIARIVLNQVASAPMDESPKQHWHIELPVVQEDTTTSATLLITRDTKRENGQDNDQWSVTLELDPKGLGKLSSHIRYLDGKISTNFQCEESGTTRMISDRLGKLRQRFQAAGLKPGKLSAQHGRNGTNELITRFKGLVDEKA